jgi:F-type H+-transporting ATPase subunit epsilon
VATFQFELVGPERVLFSGPVEAVELPGTEGDMTVLPGHAPVLTALKTGVVVITERPEVGKRVLVRGGFADIGASSVTVIAERASPVEELTPEIIDRDIAAAELARDSTTDSDARMAQDAAIAQLREARETLKF